jgi:hypothetical protein
MPPADPCPSEANSFFQVHALCLLASWYRWTGTHLIDPNSSAVEQARLLFEAPFVVLSHDAAKDPLLNYANQSALQLFEMNWDELVRTPSRLTAEPLEREARAALLATVSRQGHIDNYRGVRVTRSGRRFLIERASVWNLVDEAGVYCGQAATFRDWKYIAQDESE